MFALGDGRDRIVLDPDAPEVRSQTVYLQGGLEPGKLNLHLSSGRGLWNDLPASTVWKMASALGAARSASGEATAAGADLAQQYAALGTMANVAQVPALALIGSSGFGDLKQALSGSALVLADGSALLM